MGKPVSLPCLCATIRRAARTVTNFYDEALHESGLTIAQFTILQALQRAGPVSQGQLGEILAIDSTTLTRNLRALLDQGWVQRAQARDRRAWSLTLSELGNASLLAALPDWELAQASLRKKLGRQSWLDTFQTADDLTNAVQTTGEIYDDN